MSTCSKSLRCHRRDEHILRRLGGAVIMHWKALTPGMQDVLLTQATFIQDRESAAALREVIEAFVRERQPDAACGKTEAARLEVLIPTA